MSASSAAASRVARPHCILPSAAIASCCSKPTHRLGRIGPQRRPGDPGFASGQQKLVQQVGCENARRMWDISVEGLQLLRERVEQHRHRLRSALGPDARRDQAATARASCCGAATKPRALRLSTSSSFWSATRVESVARDEALLRGRLRQRQRSSASAQLHARSCAAAHEAAERTIHENTRVTNLQLDDPAVVTTRERTRQRASSSCSAATPTSDALVPSLRARIMPVGTYIVATEPLGEARMHAPDPREHRGHGHQLRARLLPPLRRPPAYCSVAVSATRGSMRSTPRAPRASAC